MTVRKCYIFKLGFFIYFILASSYAFAEGVNKQRAHFHYQMFCQGCHVPEAMGQGDVPRINNFIGYFLKVPGGREFLVQVPGSANAPLSDAHLAELLNWIIMEYGGTSVPENFEVYTEAEVRGLRQQPLLKVTATRAQLVKKIGQL